MLFTPTLGLFSTLHHGRLGALPPRYSFVGARHTDWFKSFEYDKGGKNISFIHAWSTFQLDGADTFLDMPHEAIVGIMLTGVLFHVITSSCTLKVMLKDVTMPHCLIQGFYSIVNPPLHFDWELYHNFHGNSIKRGWRREVLLQINILYMANILI